MSDLVLSGSKHPSTTVINAATLYASLGNYSQVARDTGICRQSIMEWANGDRDQSTIWHDALDKARQEISQEILAQNLAIAKRANVEVLDRIEGGDYKHTNDGMVRVPMTGKDLSVVSGIKEDKARVALNQPTAIRGDSDSIKSLQAQFIKLSQSHKNIQDSVCSVQGDDD